MRGTWITGVLSAIAGLALLPAPALAADPDAQADPGARATVLLEACTTGVFAACSVDAIGVWGPSAAVAPGMVTTFRVTVHNTGTADLTGVAVARTALPGCRHTIGALAAGDTVSYICFALAIHDVTERVTVTGRAVCPAVDCPTVSVASDPVTIRVVYPPDTAPVAAGRGGAPAGPTLAQTGPPVTATLWTGLVALACGVLVLSATRGAPPSRDSR